MSRDSAAPKQASTVALVNKKGKVFATLDGMGCRPLCFPDHHRYTPDEIMTLVEEASERGAMLVTTEKDFVRLPDEAWPMVDVLSVRLLWADAETLDRVLVPLLAPA